MPTPMPTLQRTEGMLQRAELGNPEGNPEGMPAAKL